MTNKNSNSGYDSDSDSDSNYDSDSNSNDERQILYINFNIKKYRQIDDIMDLVMLIDEKICIKEKICTREKNSNTNKDIMIKISRTKNTQYDYLCDTSILYKTNALMEYFDKKFKQIENSIKLTNQEFGYNWYIDYEIIYL